MACFWALLFSLYAYEASWLPPWPASTPEEDAFISFRFADNLAEGYGPVFNRGGRAVEGYTNFLWVAWLAALHRQWPDTVLHALWSGFALGFLVLSLGAHALLRAGAGGRWAATAARAALALGVLAGGVPVAASFARPTAAVVRRGAPLLDAASPTAETTGSLREGEVVPVLEASGAWLRVEDNAGARGWAHSGDVRRLDTPPGPPRD